MFVKASIRSQPSPLICNHEDHDTIATIQSSTTNIDLTPSTSTSTRSSVHQSGCKSPAEASRGVRSSQRLINVFKDHPDLWITRVYQVPRTSTNREVIRVNYKNAWRLLLCEHADVVSDRIAPSPLVWTSPMYVFHFRLDYL